MDPTTAAFRIHLGAEGLVISGSTKVPYDDGTCYLFNKFTGWDEPPALTQQIQKRVNDHGSTAGQGFQGERNLVIEGWVVVPGDNPDQLRAAVDRLFAALPLTEELMVVHEYGLVRHLYVRQAGQPTGDRIGRKAGKHRVAKFSIQLVALEPSRLSGDGTAPDLHQVTPAGAAGSLTVATGDGLVPPHLVTVGPCTNPHVAVGTQAAPFWVETVIPDGQTLQIDFKARSITLNGGLIDGAMRGSWPSLDRHSNDFAFTADTYTAATTFAVDTYTSYP